MDNTSCSGLCHISQSRVADLCLLVYNACPSVHSTDSLPDLHTGVSQYRVKETHIRLRKYAHISIDIHILYILSLLSQ